MSCHYSCLTCSGSIYYDLCTACPATRTLLVNTCPCSSGYYEYQQSQCTASGSTGTLDSSILNTTTFVFYAAIGIHYLIIVLTINRVLSIKLKKIIDVCQVLALISYYRFLQTEVATSGLKILDAFNFSYLTNLICTHNGPPYLCSNFQNLFGVGFSLIIFFLLFLLSYIIALCIYNSQVTGKESLGFLTYWHSLAASAFFLYLDQTAIQTTLSICRIAIINPYGLLIGVPFLIMIVLIVRAHFVTINAPQQTTLAHRAKNSYFYYYDELYHLYYIDHLFQEQNLNDSKQTLKRPFYPQSNLMIMELLFKIFLAASTIVCYEYEPYLFAYCCIFVLVAYCCMTKVFYGYQLSEMWFYYFLIALHIFALVLFPVSRFFTYFILATALGMNILALVFIVTTVLAWKKQKEGEMFIKTFELQHDKSQKIANLEESESQLMANKNQDIQISHLNHQNLQPSLIDSPKERQNSFKMMSHKNSIPDLSLNSLKKQSASNMNQQKPVRQIYRKTFNQDTTSNRLTVRNKNSNQQLLNTIREPSKGENTVNGDGNRMTKNIFAQINDSP